MRNETIFLKYQNLMEFKLINFMSILHSWILLARRALVVGMALFLFVTPGCKNDDQESPEVHGHDIPEHKPQDFPEAIANLRELFLDLQDALSNGEHQRTRNELLPIIQDVAHWIPELAAESDMPEKTWNYVFSVSKQLEDQFREVEKMQLKSTDALIAKLEQVVLESDPSWFEQAYRRDQRKESEAKESVEKSESPL